MRLFLDACVLFPVATREILLAYARAGGFDPRWSDRVVEEWRRAADAKQGAEDALRAGGDAALMGAWFPAGRATGWEALAETLDAPDPADAHVAAAAHLAGAEAILTFNLRDFPPRLIRPLGLVALHPDAFLAGAWARDGARLDGALAPLRAMAAARGQPFRAFLKRAGLPRLGKAAAG